MYKKTLILLLFLIVFLVVYGLIMLYSASYADFGERLIKRQLTWVVTGAIFALVLQRLDYRWIVHYITLPMVAVFACLAYLALANVAHTLDLFPEGWLQYLPFLPEDPPMGSYRWLDLRFLTVQPSSFAKLIVVLFLADYWNRHARHALEFKKGFMKPVGITGGIVVLILAAQDLGTSVILGAMILAMAFTAGVRLRYLLLVVVLGAGMAGGMIYTSPTRMSRITHFQNPQLYKDDAGYQLWCSQLALGSGGWTGVGFTQSRLKQHYLPEAHTDFIVSVIGEELGFTGVALLMMGYIGLLLVVLRIASIAVERTGILIASGIGITLGLQAFVNLAVVSGFLPTTGMPAPFVSYGGSSTVTYLIAMGFLFSILRVTEQHAGSDEVQKAVEPKQAAAYNDTIGRRKGPDSPPSDKKT